MVKHIVMWTLKANAEGKNKEENLYLMKARLEGLKDKIAGIQELEVGINCNQSPDACDIAAPSTDNAKAAQGRVGISHVPRPASPDDGESA